MYLDLLKANQLQLMINNTVYFKAHQIINKKFGSFFIFCNGLGV
jgi:hypothetical protein